MNCQECREHLYSFLDGELDGEVLGFLRGHLDECIPCFKRSELEGAFRRTVQARGMADVALPPGIEQRLRRAIDDEDRRRTAGGSGLRPLAWAVGGLALLLGAVALLPSSAGQAGQATAGPVQVRGRLECLECTLATRRASDATLRALLPAAAPEAHAEHHFGLRTEDGAFWALRCPGPCPAPLDEAGSAGRTVSIVGIAWPDLRVLEVSRLDAQAASSTP